MGLKWEGVRKETNGTRELQWRSKNRKKLGERGVSVQYTSERNEWRKLPKRVKVFLPHGRLGLGGGPVMGLEISGYAHWHVGLSVTHQLWNSSESQISGNIHTKENRTLSVWGKLECKARGHRLSAMLSQGTG